MEYLKMKLPLILGVLTFILLCFLAYDYLFLQETFYYTKIDNTKIIELQNQDMKYEYKLDCYQANGKKKTLSFKTSRVLREDAYLKLKYLNLTGVNSWEEVEYKSIPDVVREKYID